MNYFIEIECVRLSSESRAIKSVVPDVVVASKQHIALGKPWKVGAWAVKLLQDDLHAAKASSLIILQFSNR